MKYTDEQIHARESPLVWDDPPLSYLNYYQPHWRRYKELGGEGWQNILQHYSSIVNPSNPKYMRCCDLCGTVSENTTWFMRHLDTYKHRCSVAKLKGKEKPPDPLYCAPCEFRGRNTKHLREHKKSHEHYCVLAKMNGEALPTDEQTCELCTKRFASKQAFRKHLESKTHKQKALLATNDSLYVCKDCDCHYSTLQHYQTHLQSQKHLVATGKEKKTTLNTDCLLCGFHGANRKKY